MNNNQNVNMQDQIQNQQANMQQGANMQNGMQNQQLNPYIVNQNGLNNNPYVNQQAVNMQDPNMVGNQNGFNSGDFVKGALIGAGVAFLLTNKTTQQAIFNGFSKGSELFQAGIEELKERMEDAKAQMEAKDF